MAEHPPTAPGVILRHFTVAVFVVFEGTLLLHRHRRLGKWLPPGGHVEPSELPDEAAVREVLEETGVPIRLLGRRGLSVGEPRQLVVPAGIQVEPIYDGHEHIDLVYFAAPEPYDAATSRVAAELAARDGVGWHQLHALAGLGASDEIQQWARRALAEVPALRAATTG